MCGGLYHSVWWALAHCVMGSTTLHCVMGSSTLCDRLYHSVWWAGRPWFPMPNFKSPPLPCIGQAYRIFFSFVRLESLQALVAPCWGQGHFENCYVGMYGHNADGTFSWNLGAIWAPKHLQLGLIRQQQLDFYWVETKLAQILMTAKNVPADLSF